MSNLYNKRQVIINSIMSIVQTILTGACFFVLYGFILRTIGTEKLGIWSLVLATANLVGANDLGFASGVVKFVAKYNARKEEKMLRMSFKHPLSQ